jgi:hypothetical protein
VPEHDPIMHGGHTMISYSGIRARVLANRPVLHDSFRLKLALKNFLSLNPGVWEGIRVCGKGIRVCGKGIWVRGKESGYVGGSGCVGKSSIVL